MLEDERAGVHTTCLYLLLMFSRESLSKDRSAFLTFSATLGSFNLVRACMHTQLSDS